MDIPCHHYLHPGFGHQLLREWQTYDALVTKSNLVYPIFVLDVDGEKRPISSMPEQYQWCVDRLDELLEPLVKKGLVSVILFGVITQVEKKDANGTFAPSVLNV